MLELLKGEGLRQRVAGIVRSGEYWFFVVDDLGVCSMIDLQTGFDLLAFWSKPLIGVEIFAIEKSIFPLAELREWLARQPGAAGAAVTEDTTVIILAADPKRAARVFNDWLAGRTGLCSWWPQLLRALGLFNTKEVDGWRRG